MTYQGALCIIFASFIVSTTAQIEFGTTFSGDGTFYGNNGGGGNCAILPRPSVYEGRLAVAMNNAQYAGSAACGACLRISGSGEGLGNTPIIGPIDAYVADRCPECSFGDVDLAQSGDGRFSITWEFVPCPTSGTIEFLYEGSNEFFIKIQPRGMPSPATRANIAGREARREQDNFFVVDQGGPFPNPFTIEVYTVLGDSYTRTISGFQGVVA